MAEIIDRFDGGNAALISSAKALLDIDAAGALKPRLGGHARTIIEAFIVRMNGSDLVRTDLSRDPWIQADA